MREPKEKLERDGKWKGVPGSVVETGRLYRLHGAENHKKDIRKKKSFYLSLLRIASPFALIHEEKAGPERRFEAISEEAAAVEEIAAEAEVLLESAGAVARTCSPFWSSQI